jgi:hypothetical protein
MLKLTPLFLFLAIIVSIFLAPIILPLLILIIILLRAHAVKQQYERSNYKAASGNSFVSTIFNKGNRGEFLTFQILEKLPGDNKLLTNIYIPKNDRSTTEIDVLMISKTGIYVFESKNYSGWIFGDDKSKYWTQSLKGGKKYKFYNPILQNRVHTNAAKGLLKEIDDSYFYSYIVFSERCSLKKVSVAIPNVYVIKREDLLQVLQRDMANTQKFLSESQIENAYTILKKYSLADGATKGQHIEHIKEKIKKC